MNRVYIYNANFKGMFNSILMNDLNSRGIRFNNIQTTKIIDTNNVLIYIPKSGISDEPIDLMNAIDPIADLLADFKVKMVLTNSGDDHTRIKKFIDGYIGRNRFKYYIGIDFDTTLSSVVTNDCLRTIRRFNKFHSK